MSIAKWIRGWLRGAWSARRAGSETVSTKLQALADAAAQDFPTGDIEDVLGDIEAGRAAVWSS